MRRQRERPNDDRDPLDSRDPSAKAYQWASKVMTISLEMVVPGLLGLALDHYLKTKAIFCLIGFAAGMSFGIWHILQMTSDEEMKED